VVLSGLVISSCLLAFAFVWAYTARLPAKAPLRRSVQTLVSLPVQIWLLLGIVAFALPVLEYWITARSHSNALAGFLPWVDAAVYFQCSEVYLLGLDVPAHCGKRPYYFAFFADLLWLAGNRLQIALLLQALILGAMATLFALHISRTLNIPSALAAYSVLFVYSAALCSGLVMTENIGLILGTLGILLPWQYVHAPNSPLFVIAIAILAASVSARPGPLFVLPALLLWFLVCAQGPLRMRILWDSAAGLAATLTIAFVASPILIAGGSFNSTHSNFSYSLYGLIVGGKGWWQVTIDHPEIFTGTDGLPPTDKVYALALESLHEKPHLFVLGYIKGLIKYFDDLFRYATGLKLLRLGLLLIPWICGAWYALRRWRELPYSLLLAIEAGIIVSSPFLIYDAHNRAFASTVAVDALFAGLGLVWIYERLDVRAKETKSTPLRFTTTKRLAAIGLAALLLPVVMFAVVRPTSAPTALKAPECETGQQAVALNRTQGTLVLPIVAAGGEQLYPLAVRADHFSNPFHLRVQAKDELVSSTGTNLIWGLRLEAGSGAAPIYFRWNGSLPTDVDELPFCVQPPVSGKRLGTGTLAQPH